MKKLIAIISIIMLILSMSVCAFATEKEDLFYYDVESNSQLQQVIKDYRSESISLASHHFNQLYKDKELDESKFTFHPEKTYARYEWSYSKIAAFMKAEDKKAFLETLKLYCVFYPVLYDGKVLDGFYNFRDVYSFDEEINGFRQSTYALTINRYNQLTNKEEAEKILKIQGFEDYEVLQTAEVGDNWFIIAQKENETVAIYVSPENMTATDLFLYPNIINDYKYPFNDSIKELKMHDIYKEKFEKMIFTISDMEALSKTSSEIDKELSKLPPVDLVGGSGEANTDATDKVEDTKEINNQETDTTVSTVGDADNSDVETSANADGTVTTGELLAEDDGEGSAKPFPWKYVGIGAGALVLSGVLALVLVLILKKKKAA